MIETRVMNGRICPVVICDACGLQIERASAGLVVTKENGAVEFRHRSAACDVPYAVRAVGEGWEAIDSFWFYICNNLKVDMKWAKRSAKRAALLDGGPPNPGSKPILVVYGKEFSRDSR